MRRLAFYTFWLFILTIPVENMITIEGFGTFNRVLGVICICLAGLSVLVKGEARVPERVLIFSFIFVLWTMATIYWTVDLISSKTLIITFVQLLGFVWLIWELAVTDKEQNTLLASYVLGAYAAISSILYHYHQGIQSSWFRYSARGFDPNDIGLTLAIGVPIAWYLALKETHKVFAAIYYLYVPMAFFAIILTASRSAFLALLISMIYILWTFFNSSWGPRLISSGVLVTTVFLLVFVAPDFSLDRIASIVTKVSSADFNARESIWLNGLKVFSEHPVVGVGVGGFSYSVAPYMGKEFAPHNLFLSILVGQGIIGLVLFLIIIFVAASNIKWMPVLQSRMWIILLSTWFVGVMTLSWSYSKPTWFLVGFLAVQGALVDKGKTRDKVLQKGVS